MNALSASDIWRHGRFLWPARIAWLLLLVLIVSLLAVNAPSNVVYARLEYDVQQARPAILTFTSLSTFAGWLVAARWLIVAVYFAVALLIAWRKWHDWFALSVSAALLALAWGFVLRGDHGTWLYPGLLRPLASEIAFILSQLTVDALVLLFFLFPNGRFAFRWQRWPAMLAIAATALFFHADTFRFTWRAYQPFLEQLAWPLWGAILLSSLLVAMTGQLYRYHRLATETEQQQMKWVLLGLAGILSIPLLSWPLEDAGAWGAMVGIGIKLLAAAFLPITIGFSILRYRLWDVDLIINRTLVFGGLTLLVAAVYILTVGLLSAFALFHSSSALLYVLATGLIAILFHPLRQRLQQAVNRLMYGDRDDPVTVLSQLAERLAQTAVPEATLPVLVETIAQTLKLPYVAIRQSEGNGMDETEVAATGAQSAQARAFPLTYQGQLVGQLLVAPRGPGESFTSAEMRLIENIARQAGTAVYAAQLTRQLQRSRERLVTTREEERRRLRRDLHDGLGPQLATLTLKVDAARNYLQPEPKTVPTESIKAAEHLLVELKEQIQEAIHDVRRLAHDLRPPALDQLGLVPALREYAAQNSANGLLITVDAPEILPPLTAAVEVAAYRIVLEAMTNAVRHAHARQCNVTLSVVNDILWLEIADNGVGLPGHAPPGVGLSSMRERTDELGGTFDLQSAPAEGVRVSIRLPLTRA
jgi:signal transduction histidine kinase